ncbi:MAG: 2-C-methyl-D-erythritol 4-phosphate cytidylyltransferase [Steroidobacteraceae bacterium]|nr:2-C-methyl-D-erythritol 4-phosphate cytidylyltransferase [Steroidobacteraceae bacterium]MCC7199047.1 2-C-methyl-D-erythritol 4-phosphate cytidylyltransferase [Gammaproteobacteria bacterium]
MSVRAWFVMPAAGASRRMGGPFPKQYLTLAGRTVIEHALRPLLASPRIAGGVVALSGDDPHWPGLPAELRARVRTTIGGAERCHSVLNGLHALAGVAAPSDWVLVHDAARPCLDPADLDRLLDACADDAVGGLLAVPLADTLKRADDDGRAIATIPREGLWRALTPQMFRFALLHRALSMALAAGEQPTDEAAAIEHLGLAPRLVAGSPANLKITHPGDLPVAAAVLIQEGLAQ